jgi:phosphoesterase RecJ-like protein
MACSDPVPPHLEFVPGAASVVHQVDTPVDLVISLDCSDIRRLGDLAQGLVPGQTPVVNIDHHITNTYFGDVNVVDETASSTAEIVLALLECMAAPMETQAATCLLTGIVTDTRGFRTNNVTCDVMEAALRLMRLGASLPAIAQQALDRRSTSAIHLWGATLSHFRLESGIGWTSIPIEMRIASGYLESGDAGLASFLVGAEEAEAVAVFVERPDGQVEVGLRAAPGFDVAQVALQFGGGGHALAAGCLLNGPLGAAEGTVLAALQADLARQRQSRA